MMDRLETLLRYFTRDFRWADLIEIVLVAVFFYVLIMWLRGSITRRASRNALVALLLFAGIYLLALVFELFFIELLIERSFILFLVACVVIFQRDIRRMIDRIGTMGLFSGLRQDQSSRSVVDTVTEAAAHLAETHTGALLVIRGHESWEHHIDGGVRLDGLISLPLLYSLFDPDTPGHDGAALLEGNRLTYFATHLPLSSYLPEASRFGGTRHAAALGLSEVCDAFVIVVSEEQGTISVAQGGELTTLGSASELRQRLEAFWQKHYEQPLRPRSRPRRTAVAALLSLTLAVLFWISFAYQPDIVYRSYVVPVELRNLPPGWVLEDPAPVEATITLSGSARAFRLLNPSDLIISFDLSSIEAGANTLEITEATLRKPETLRLYDASPEQIQLQAQQIRTVQVPVEVQTTGMLPDSLALLGLTPDPANVTIRIPQDAEPPTRLLTEAIDLSHLTHSGHTKTRLVLPAGMRLAPDQRREVVVTVVLEKSDA